MTTTLPDHGKVTNSHPPADLSEGPGNDVLLGLILDAVQCVDHSELNAAGSHAPQFRPQMMLTLLSYCSAACIYGSRSIECASRDNPTVRYICACTFPDWIAIRQFRRHHRELIEQCLAHVLRHVCGLSGPEPSQEFISAARERIEAGILMDTAEAD